MPYRWNPVACRPAAPSDAIASAGAVLDAQALARLSELDPSGRAGLVERVLGTYVLSLQRLLEQLRVARGADDAEAIRHAAHTLKSSSASVGALDLSALCAQTEALVRDGGVGGRAALEAQVERLLAEGERILAGLGGTR